LHLDRPQSRRERERQNDISERQQAQLDALAKKAPKLLEKVQAGELSCHRACVEAGIVKVPTPLEQAQRLAEAISLSPSYYRLFFVTRP
jgi:hypothetical protein